MMSELAGNDGQPRSIDVPGFRVLEMIGRGAKRVVFRALDLDKRREMAICTNHLELDGAEAARTLQREARILWRLRHPNILPVFDCFDHNGRTFLVTQYADGGSLSSRIQSSPHPPDRVVEFVSRLARALAFVHRNGVVHSNVDPHNILMVCPSIGPGLADVERQRAVRRDDLTCIPVLSGFAEAVDLEQGGSVQDSDQSNETAYMAPERVRGCVSEYGPATDSYSLGVTLHELLTGHREIPADEGGIIGVLRIASSPSFATAVERVCRKCVCFDPGERYSDGMELANELALLTADVGPLRKSIRRENWRNEVGAERDQTGPQ